MTDPVPLTDAVILAMCWMAMSDYTAERVHRPKKESLVTQPRSLQTIPIFLENGISPRRLNIGFARHGAIMGDAVTLADAAKVADPHQHGVRAYFATDLVQ